MTQTELILRLKELQLARLIAINYDYVPSPEEISVEAIQQDLTDAPTELILAVATKYEGEFAGSIESQAFHLIEKFEL